VSDVARLADAVHRLRPVPADFADYSTTPEVAARFLQVAREDVVGLADEGVRHRTGPGGVPLFEFADLYNLAALSGRGRSLFELALRFLMRFAAEPPETWFAPRDWSVKVKPPEGVDLLVRLPDADCDAVRELDVAPLDPADGVAAGADRVALPRAGLGYRVRLRGRHDTVRAPEVVAAHTEVLDALLAGAVSYQTVPENLRGAAGRAWELGVADCVVVAKVLAERLRAGGFRARARRGYLLGLMGSDHAWAEVWEDGRWKQVDPVAAGLATGRLRDLGFTPHPDFFDACLGSSFNRFLPCRTTEAEPLLTLADGTAPHWVTAAISAGPIAEA